MEAFSLIAKLLLNTDEYKRALDEAEKAGSQIRDPDEPSLGLDTAPFDNGIVEAENTDVADPDSPELDLDTEPYNGSLDQAKADTESWSAAIGDIFSDLKGVLAAAGITATISGIVSSLSEAVDLARSMGDNIDKQSRAMSISTDAYQELSHVLDINGASITDLNRGLMNMRKLMGGGEASKEFTDGMDRLGLSAKVANGEITDTESLLKASLKALADYDGTDRDYITQAIFGRNGTKLNAMFDGTSQDIDALIQQAHELGLVMTKEEVANAASYNDAVTNMKASMDAFKTSVVSEIIPALTDVANTIAGIFASLNPRNRESSLADTFSQIDIEATKAQLSVDEANVSAKKLIEDLQSMGDYWTLDEEGKMTWDALAAKALDLFPKLSEYIDTDGKKISGNTAEIEKNIDAWSRLEKQRILSSALEEKQTAVADKLTKAYEKGAEARAKEAESEGKRVTAYKEIDEFLSQDRNAGYRRNLESNYGYTGKMTDEIWNQVGGSINAWMEGKGYSGMREWQEAKKQAKDLREESDSLKDEATKAQDELKNHAKYLSEEMGLAETQVYSTRDAVVALQDALSQLGSFGFGGAGVISNMLGGLFHSHAIGSAYIPYDNYPALLHRGERIETATQARQSESVDFSGLEDRIVNAIRSGMESAHVEAVVSERDVARGTNRYNGREIDAGRFVP